MAAPNREPPAADHWSETDQEIIESLLMVDGSTRHPQHTDPPVAHVALPVLTAPRAILHVPPSAPADMRPHAIVPVAFWVPTPPAAYYAHARPVAVQPTFFAPTGVPRPSEVDMEVQEMLSEEERKAKHREVQRRFVQRKKDQMERIRREAATLEKRLSCLKLSQEQISLEKEKDELLEQVDDVDDVRIPTPAEINLVLEAECSAGQESFTRISDDAYSELLHETMDIVHDAVIKDARKLDDRTKVQLLGWTGRRVVEAKGDDTSTAKFELAKQFPGVDMDGLVDRAWADIRDPTKHRRLFDSSIMMKLVKLQDVNDDAVVFCKAVFNPRTAAVHHAVELFCRIRRNDEILIVTRDLYAHKRRSVSVLAFAEDTNTMTLRYNGHFYGSCDANLRFWLLEILFVLVRFEAMVVAPLFTLAPPQE